MIDHLGIQVAEFDRAAAFFDVAVGLGAEVLHAPKEWPEYHPGYFGAFVRDPDGNNVEAVHHTFE
jgi:catechol 2,3-dioxygenase-like lactoylglutathione lyase family enzyme